MYDKRDKYNFHFSFSCIFDLLTRLLFNFDRVVHFLWYLKLLYLCIHKRIYSTSCTFSSFFTCTTNPFAMFEPQIPSTAKFYVAQSCWWTDFEALQLWKTSRPTLSQYQRALRSEDLRNVYTRTISETYDCFWSSKIAKDPYTWSKRDTNMWPSCK